MSRWHALAATGILIPPSLVIGFYMYIGTFSRMIGDDYCSLYIGQRLGLLRSIWYWYRTWHGCFSASAADWVVSLLGPRSLSFHTFVLLFLWVAFAVFAAGTALRYRTYLSPSPFSELVPGVLIVFITLSLSPDLSQSLFWWGGARGYLSPIIFFTLYLALYCYFLSSVHHGARKRIWLLVDFVCAFCLGGFSETFTPVVVVMLTGIIGMIWLVRRFTLNDPALLFAAAGLGGALLSLFVIVLAPGNASRQAYFPARLDVLTMLSVAFSSYIRFLTHVFSGYRLVGVLGAVFAAIWQGMELRRAYAVSALRGAWIYFILFAGFILAFGCFVPAVYGTSEPPPERVLIIPSFFLVGCLLISGFILGERLANRVALRRTVSAALPILSCLLIAVASWNAFQILYLVREEYISFAQQWDRVDAEIRSAQRSGEREIIIPALENWAGLEYPSDNPKYWPNICYSKYYDIDVLAHPR